MPGPCASVGVQVSTPVFASMVAPLGGATRMKVSVFAGTSASKAVAVTDKVLPSLIVSFGRAASTGAELVSLTITVKLFALLKPGVPLSVTRIVMVFVLGPCASLGVQVKTPVAGSTLAPAGAPGSSE